MMIEAISLCCGYQPQREIIRNISFTMNSGEICCILGPNGSGKSTLFKTLLKLLKPLSGRVFIDGDDIRGWSPKRLAGLAAYVPQAHTPPFPYLVAEMVMLGRMSKLGPFRSPGEKDRELVAGILESLGIAHLAMHPYTEISGGERQMVMLGKALAQEPKLLVLDEPTANLDYGNKVLVLEKIASLAGSGLCVVFTSHDPEQALLLNSRTLLLFANQPPLFGGAAQVVTERNLKHAYNAQIRVVEIIDPVGLPVRVCIPLINHPENPI